MHQLRRYLLGSSPLLQVGLLLFFNPLVVLAQDSTQNAGSGAAAGQEKSKKEESADSSPASAMSASWADSYIRQLGSSGLLAGSREGIGWGSFYVSSGGVTGVVDRFSGTGTLPSATYLAAVLQTTVIYDHRIGSGRFAIQYQPSMAIAEGQVVGNFSNQNTNIDLLIYSRPRWNVRFSDGFRYYYTQQTNGLSYLDINPATLGSVTNGFLDGPERWLSNNAYFSVAYAFSPRSSVSVTPTFMFAESGTAKTFQRAAAYGGSVSWSYRTSHKQSVGIMYSSELMHQTTTLVTETVFHTIAATASRQISATWFLQGAAGVTTSAIASYQKRNWSAYGSFGLLKQIKKSSIGISYYRTDTLANGLISNIYADRIDGTFQSQLTRRLSWSAGAGYLRQVQSGGFQSWYSSATAQYLLAPKQGVFATLDYAHKYQSGNLNNLFTGDRDILSFGIRWQPGRVAH
jgi:hypothetical protein